MTDFTKSSSIVDTPSAQSVKAAIQINEDNLDDFIAHYNANNDPTPDEIESGTKMVFYQASAPTGWTKDTTHGDKALRVVSGSGGGSGGTHNLSSPPSTSHGHSDTFSVANHTLTLSQIPSHTHGGGFWVSGSSWGFTSGSSVKSQSSTNSAGGGGGHNHGLTGSVSSNGPTAFAPKYIDVIVCEKD